MASRRTDRVPSAGGGSAARELPPHSGRWRHYLPFLLGRSPLPSSCRRALESGKVPRLHPDGSPFVPSVVVDNLHLPTAALVHSVDRGPAFPHHAGMAASTHFVLVALLASSAPGGSMWRPRRRRRALSDDGEGGSRRATPRPRRPCPPSQVANLNCGAVRTSRARSLAPTPSSARVKGQVWPPPRGVGPSGHNEFIGNEGRDAELMSSAPTTILTAGDASPPRFTRRSWPMVTLVKRTASRRGRGPRRGPHAWNRVL
jgi:hypothetical protein